MGYSSAAVTTRSADLSASDLDDVPRVGSLKPELLSRPRLFSGVYAKLGAADRTTAVQRGRELRLL